MTSRRHRILVLSLVAGLTLCSLAVGRSDSVLEEPEWTFESNQESGFLGSSVASAGDVNGDGYDEVIIGAYGFNGGETDEGKVFLFYGSEEGLADTAGWTAEGNVQFAQFGYSVASAGDVNGDEFDDVIIGARLFTDEHVFEGRVFLYLGSPSGLADSAAWTGDGDQVSGLFGHCVAGAGDVNNDGYDDVIIGAFVYENGQTDEGAAFLYLGSETGLADTAAWTAEGDQENALFGSCVAGAGNVNGDDFDDIIVGASGYDNGEPDEGRAYLFLGSESGLADSAAWVTEINHGGANYGISVATAGDVNGDTFDDVIVGAHRFDGDEIDGGAAFLYLGSSSGLPDSSSWSVVNDVAAAEFGTSVATAGDVDKDGYSDVIIGAPGFDIDRSEGGDALLRGIDEGGAFLYMGSDTGLAVTPASFALGGAPSTYYGNSVASAGDVNNDSFADLVVGAFRHDGPEQDEGHAYAYWNSSATGIPLPGFSPNAERLRILLSHPNPSKARTKLTYVLVRSESVELTIYDIRGRRIAEIVNGVQDPGIHTIVWNRQNQRGIPVSPGTYFGRLTAGRDVETVKIVIAN